MHFVYSYAKQKHLGCKKARGQSEVSSSNIANRQARPKGLISAEAKKLLYQIFVIPYNIIAYFHKYDWLSIVTCPPFIIVYRYKKGGQVTKPIILVKICYNIVCHSRNYKYLIK